MALWLRFTANALVLALPALAQNAGTAFEVVSIKPAAVAGTGAPPPFMGMRRGPERIDIGRWSIKQLILRAHGLWPSQLAGPEWMEAERFDLFAKLPAGARPEQLPEMLQAMLADRFGLKTHREMRTIPVFALTVARGGAKMRRGEDDDPSAPLTGGTTEAARVERIGRMLDRIWGTGEDLGLQMGPSDANLRVEFTKMPMPALAQILASYLRAPVLDETGLDGNYQAALEFSPPDADALLAAVGRLGLRLERRKAPVEVLVVDRLARMPSPN